MNEEQKAVTEEATPWSRAHRFCRGAFFASPFGAILILGMPLLAEYLDKELAANVGLYFVLPAFLLYAFTWLVLGVTLSVWQCPKCGKSFHVAWERWYGNLFGSKCCHCGYRIQ